MQDFVGQSATLQAGMNASEMNASGLSSLQLLQKENRILKKKLERFEADYTRLENVNRNKERLLKQVIVELQASQSVLEHKSSDLEDALAALHQTQAQLIESEKLAALGRLVAGVAHEINTPLGTAVTVASTLVDETRLFQRAIAKAPSNVLS
jgi:two-component system, NtrC family, sensor kinase